MKRVLVTGAAGFVGRHTLELLVDHGYEVHAVTSRESRPDGVVRWHRVDLRDGRATRALLETARPSHLLHLAWSVEPGRFWTSAENLDWVGASLQLLRAFTEAGGRRAVVAGSAAEYAWEEPVLSEAGTALAPATLYGTCKHALHRIAAAYAAGQGRSLAWGRVFWMYGPHEAPGRLVSSVARALVRGEPAMCSSGRQRRDFLHVRDVAAAFVALVDADLGGAVNIGSGDAVPVRQVAETLARLCGRPELLRLGALPDREDEPPTLCADTTRLRSATGWSPRISLEDGLRETLDWWGSRTIEGDDG